MIPEVCQAIIELTGPCRILHYGCKSPFLVEALLSKGCDAYGQVLDGALSQTWAPHRFLLSSSANAQGLRFDAVVVDPSLVAGTSDCVALLQGCHLLCRRLVLLWVEDVGSMLKPIVGDHEVWEEAALRSGFRRHLSSWSRDRFFRSRQRGLDRITCFERIDDGLLAAWPVENSSSEPRQEQDMSRVAGARAEACLVRYSVACEWIRRGDTVLDCECGSGYGTALMASRSLGCRYIGIDPREQRIRYARAHFARYRVDFDMAQAERLSVVRDSSVDFMASFDTLEHLTSYDRFLAEAERVLKPDGRLILGVPNVAVDGVGANSDSSRWRGLDYRRLKTALDERFVVEARYGLAAPGCSEQQLAKPFLAATSIEPNGAEDDAEWWIVVASANSLRKTKIAYCHPEFDRSALPAPFHVTDFATHYRNPWIYRQVIQKDERLRAPEILMERLEVILSEADPTSPDYGSALTVRGYLLLEMPVVASETVFALLANCDAYLALPGSQPHQVRWRTSLAYLAAQLALRQGQREAALEYLRLAQRFDPVSFSPLIATKCTAAAYLSGVINLSDGHADLARSAFLSGIRIARQALQSTDENAIGNPEAPLTFGFQELSDVAETAGQCALALRYLDEFTRDPGRFYRLVNPRRQWLSTTSAVGWSQQHGARSELASLNAVSRLVHEIRHESTPLRRLINRVLSVLFGVRLVREHMLAKIQGASEQQAGGESLASALRAKS